MGYPECEVVKLTRVSLHFLTKFFYLTLVFFIKCFFWKFDFFSSIFLWVFFFNFIIFVWNNFPLSFVMFLLFFLFGYYDEWLVKLTRVSLSVFWRYVFLLNFVFFARYFFWIFFIMGCKFIKLDRVDSDVLLHRYIFWFFFYFWY